MRSINRCFLAVDSQRIQKKKVKVKYLPHKNSAQFKVISEG